MGIEMNNIEESRDKPLIVAIENSSCGKRGSFGIVLPSKNPKLIGSYPQKRQFIHINTVVIHRNG